MLKTGAKMGAKMGAKKGAEKSAKKGAKGVLKWVLKWVLKRMLKRVLKRVLKHCEKSSNQLVFQSRKNFESIFKTCFLFEVLILDSKGELVLSSQDLGFLDSDKSSVSLRSEIFN